MNEQSGNLFEHVLGKLLSTHESFKSLLQIIREIPEGNFFVSGGTVRDTLIGNDHSIKDVDIFLTIEGFLKIESFLNLNGNVVSNQFGTKRWFPDDNKTLYYDIIQISKFYNGLWPCRDMIDVLNQFDITANAVAFDLVNGKFYNPQNGLQDIKDRKLRAIRFDFPELLVSEAVNISRNSLLCIRYQFYAKKLNFEIEPITKKWLTDNNFRSADLEKFKKYFFDPHLTL